MENPSSLFLSRAYESGVRNDGSWSQVSEVLLEVEICPLSSRGRELRRAGEKRSPLSFEERRAFGAEGGVVGCVLGRVAVSGRCGTCAG